MFLYNNAWSEHFHNLPDNICAVLLLGWIQSTVVGYQQRWLANSQKSIHAIWMVPLKLGKVSKPHDGRHPTIIRMTITKQYVGWGTGGLRHWGMVRLSLSWIKLIRRQSTSLYSVQVWHEWRKICQLRLVATGAEPLRCKRRHTPWRPRTESSVNTTIGCDRKQFDAGWLMATLVPG